MNTFKKLRNAALFLGMGALILTSCNDDDDEPCNCPAPPTNNVVKSGFITEDETWTSDNIYELAGKVVVDEGATLTIQPGTIIKGREGQNTAASALVITRGSFINAVGEPDSPIIFTSVIDNITVGSTSGTNLEREDNQLWGGVIILGSAPISAQDGDTETNIEGIPAEEGYGLYGGTDEEDDSGDFSYVSIRHGGISIGDGNEINGLTLGGVGNETNISNVEVYATLDDGIECFGGSVNINNALVYYQGDDGIDLDMNYSGMISNFAVIHGDGIGTDESLEIDGPENTTYTEGFFTLMNGICRIEGADGSAADYKSKAQGTTVNVTHETTNAVKVRASFDDDCTTDEDDAYTYLVNDSRLSWDDSNFESIEVYTSSDNGAEPPVDCTVPGSYQTAAQGAVNTNGAGASLDLNAVFGWTLAASKGQL